MKFQVKWGRGKNTSDGVYDTKGVLGNIRECSYCNTEWEEKMWEVNSIGDFFVEVVELKVGETIYIPYQGDELLPEVLMITKIEEGSN